MTVLLLTTEAAAVFGVTTYLLLRTWTRNRAVTMADVFFYDRGDGTRLPGSRTAGPRVVGEHGAAGFERSPLGAVIAAINLAHRAAGAAGAAGASGANGVTEPNGVTVVGRSGASWYQVQITGWEVEHYSSRKAAIRYLLTRPVDDGIVVTTTMRVEVNWVDDDWRMVAPSTGDWTDAFISDEDVSGFSSFPSQSRSPAP